jgi:amino acid adenylation domain-containing protein
LFDEQVEKTPDTVAVVFEDRQISYEELNLRANQLAHYLLSLGIKADNPVGICLDRSLEMVIGLYGIIKAGGAYVPFDPQYPDNRLLYMLSQSKVTTVLTQKKSGNRFSKIISEDLSDNKPNLICLDSDWDVISKEKKEAPGIAVSDKNLAYVIYTSGSTGNPKGVMTSHQGIRNRLLWMQDEYQLNDMDCILQKTTFCFDDSVIEFFWPLITGAKLVVAIPEGHKDGKYLVKTVIEQGVSTLQFVPSMLKIFIEDEDVKGCNTLKRVICSGEALPYELQKQYYSAIDTTLNNLYGPTEASVDVTYWACKKNDSNGIVYIGRPMSNTQVYITDAQMNPVPVKVSGELHVGGIQLSRGYLYRPDLTANKFIPNPFDIQSGFRLYKTGDLARYSEDGNIAYINRIDNQIKIRGFRIELGEIESCLREIDRIKETVVLAREDEPGEKRLVAYYTLNENIERITVDEIRGHMSSHLPDYMVPSAYVVLEEIPLAPNGKTDRKALPVPGDDAFIRGVYEAPVGEIEEALSQIWSEVLNVEKVGRNDNFFDLGGHSLLAVKLIEQIHRKGFNTDIRSLFTSATMKDFAYIIGNNTSTSVIDIPAEYHLNQFEKKIKLSTQLDITKKVEGKI